MKEVFDVPDDVEDVEVSIEDGEVIVEYDRPEPAFKFVDQLDNAVIISQKADCSVEQLPSDDGDDFIVHFTDHDNNTYEYSMPPHSYETGMDYRWKFVEMDIIVPKTLSE